MSSDNGIYILKSPKADGVGFEYRVIHAQAIDNIYWNEETGSMQEEVDPRGLVSYFGHCVALTEKDANVMALAMEREIANDDFYPIIEYGIQEIEVQHSFDWYKERARR